MPRCANVQRRQQQRGSTRIVALREAGCDSQLENLAQRRAMRLSEGRAGPSRARTASPVLRQFPPICTARLGEASPARTCKGSAAESHCDESQQRAYQVPPAFGEAVGSCASEGTGALNGSVRREATGRNPRRRGSRAGDTL